MDPLAELRTGDRWLRLIIADNRYEIHAGTGIETCASFRQPLGVCWYQKGNNLPDGERRAAWSQVDLSEDATWILQGEILDTQNGAWLAETRVSVDGEGFRLNTRFTRRGEPRAASVRVHTQFAAPPRRAYTLIPGSIYNGNRANIVVPRTYCPLPTDYELRTREQSLSRRVIADIPRQDASTWWTAHIWGYQASSASVSAYDPENQSGIHLGYARAESGRVLGVIHTADPDADFHQVTVENPCVRNRRYRLCYWDLAPDRPHLFTDGESAHVDLRLAPVSAPSIPEFVTSWQGERELRRQGKAPGQTGVAPGIPDVMPRSHATAHLIQWLDDHRWNDAGFYRNGELENPRELVLGWGHGTSMMMGMYGQGSEQVRQRIRQMIRLLLDEAQAPGGLFYGVRLNEKWLGSDGNLETFHTMGAMTVRRTTDTIPHGLELVDALGNGGNNDDVALANRLDDALRRACEALVRIVRRDGNLPFLLDPLTERAAWPGGFGGSRAIGLLARGSVRWNQPEWLTVATNLAELCVREGLNRGDVWGGPSDVMQGTTDNESLTALAEGLTHLHSVTQDPQHLQWAVQAADLLATWALDEHIEFPPESMHGRNGFHAFGAMVASTQNACGTPGLCVNSGRFLLDLYEHTGLTRLLDFLSDLTRMSMQMIIRPGQHWGELQVGQMTESASFNDALADFGTAYCISAVWPANAMLLSELDLPSVYVDGDKVWRFDHITAALNAAGSLTITNPTDYPAKYRVQWKSGSITSYKLQPGEAMKCDTPRSATS